jgi:polysaccharide export outer membrane protein
MKTRSIYLLLVLSLFGMCHGMAQERVRSGARGPGGNAAAGGVISRSDLLEVTVFREADLGTTGEVTRAGTLAVPLVGPVQVAGLTTDQASRVIESKLKNGYLVRPQVTVSIIKRVVRTVTVLGQARQPGVFTLPANRQLTLVEVIGLAGGLTEIANPKKVTLKRRATGRASIIDVRAIMQGRGRDLLVADGDVINIPESWF